MASKCYAVRAMVADESDGYACVTGAPDAGTNPRDGRRNGIVIQEEIQMTTNIKKLNNKLDDLAEHAKDGAEKLAGKAADGAEKLAGKIIDSANDVAHAAAEKARQGTAMAGEKLIDVGEKITKMAK
jgi:vacuolar-type H+-ATPase subunit H